MEEVIYEGVGPSSVAVLVEALTDNRARAVKWIKAAFRAYGGELQSSGAVSWQFTVRGRFTLPCPDASEAAQEALMDVAMAAGALDIEFPDAEEAGGEGGAGGDDGAAAAPPPPAVAYVFCDPAVLGTVRNALVAAGHTPAVTEVLRLPQSTVEVPEGDASEAFAAFLGRLEELDDVQAVVHNAAE
jgi:transcriptional/translational regulatory protein YebC/TACO1